jgi:hypothetical protein
MMLLGRLPQTGDRTDWGGWRFEIVDMDGKRIDKVLAACAQKRYARPQLDEIDAGVGMRDPAVGKVLQPQPTRRSSAGARTALPAPRWSPYWKWVEKSVSPLMRRFDSRWKPIAASKVRHERRARGTLEAEHRG